MFKDGITTIETFGDLVDEGYGLNGFCFHCGKGRKIDPASLPREQSSLNRRWRCKDCGNRAYVNISPPVPSIISAAPQRAKPK